MLHTYLSGYGWLLVAVNAAIIISALIKSIDPVARAERQRRRDRRAELEKEFRNRGDSW